MADDTPPAHRQPPLPLRPPPFIAFPFQQMRSPFWQVQDQQNQFYGIKALPPGVHFTVPDLHPHTHPHQFPLHSIQSSDGRGGVASRPSSAIGTLFATRNSPLYHGDRQSHVAYSSASSLSSQNAAAGLQLFTESPESSLLDPQTSSPPPISIRQTAEMDFSGLNLKAHAEKGCSVAFSETAPAVPGQNGQPSVYPPPLASHQDVVEHKQLFLDTLSKLHAFLGIHARVPKRVGKELDLHSLYREVTAQGGLTQVVKFKRWKGVILALELPPQVSNPSLFLQKHYINLLHHYEQVYYFRVQGQLIPPPEYVEPAKKRRKRFKTSELWGDDLGSSVGQNFMGSIEGKFEHGYLVTVVVGTEKMRGVLYHVPCENDTPQFATLPELMNKLNSPQTLSDLQAGMRRRKSKPGDTMKRDSNAPRPSRSGYNFFFAEERLKLKNYHPQKHTDITKMIGEHWQSLTPEERMPYIQRGINDKERYLNEKTEYDQKLKMQIEIRDENPIQANAESLDHGHGSEQLEQDGTHEFADASNSYQDYHAALDADLDTRAFSLPQEQSLRPQTFCDYASEVRINYGQDQGHPLSGSREQGQEQRIYVTQPAINEDEEDDDDEIRDEDDDDEDEDEDDDDLDDNGDDLP